MSRIKVSVSEDRLIRACRKLSQESREKWKRNWSWLVQEYVDLQKDLIEYKTKIGWIRKKPEGPSLKPFPKTTNGMIGWVSTKENFKLEKYGPDVVKIPFPKTCKLICKCIVDPRSTTCHILYFR